MPVSEYRLRPSDGRGPRVVRQRDRRQISVRARPEPDTSDAASADAGRSSVRQPPGCRRLDHHAPPALAGRRAAAWVRPDGLRFERDRDGDHRRDRAERDRPLEAGLSGASDRHEHPHRRAATRRDLLHRDPVSAEPELFGAGGFRAVHSARIDRRRPVPREPGSDRGDGDHRPPSRRRAGQRGERGGGGGP